MNSLTERAKHYHGKLQVGRPDAHSNIQATKFSVAAAVASAAASAAAAAPLRHRPRRTGRLLFVASTSAAGDDKS